MCKRCAAEISRTPEGTFYHGEGFSRCAAPLFYEGEVRASILRFKFKDMSGYSKLYGKLMARRISSDLKDSYDLITWVPLSKERLKKRGYDQAMLLALAVALELDDVAVETLIKHTDVPAQSGAGDAAKRKANIYGAYRASDPELILGKRILLVDDVMTTGSTLSECAVTLREAGAAEVVCAALAKTRD
jgi:ComF family protein